MRSAFNAIPVQGSVIIATKNRKIWSKNDAKRFLNIKHKLNCYIMGGNKKSLLKWLFLKAPPQLKPFHFHEWMMIDDVENDTQVFTCRMLKFALCHSLERHILIVMAWGQYIWRQRAKSLRGKKPDKKQRNAHKSSGVNVLGIQAVARVVLFPRWQASILL